LPQDTAEVINPLKWRDTNLLGFALLVVRNKLK